ncbi:MAG: SDR family NAD(P)-dependent oxidoreductase [Candidatus Bathyarchaeia archaeon]
MLSTIKGKLEDRVAIVTGASRGIGRAIALALAHEGAKVVVNYRREESKAREVVEQIKQFGGSALAFQADVGDRRSVEMMVAEVMKEFGRIDILVNNAGVSLGAGSLLGFNEEEYDLMWQVNVKGMLYCTRAVAPHMIQRRYGKIVNIASIAGLGTALLPGNMLYALTKAAVIILTKRIALELGNYGINVNAIAPGLIRTEMGLNYVSTKDLQYFEERSILHHIGEPEEVASLALFLASDESSFITGQVITVDGGRIDFITHSF